MGYNGRMKRILAGIAVLLLISSFIFFTTKSENKKETPTQNPTPTASQVLSSTSNKETKILFVPYWGQTQERIPDKYGDALIYFGIAPGKDGIDKEEPGYLGLARFEAISEGRITLLILRMIDQDMSFSILKDKKLQEKIITETVEVAKQYGLEGIVLDLEISSLPFASITNQMNSFVEDFSKATKKESLSFSMMFFGDTFYRLRPYDVVTLIKHLDRAMIMAYDFHKAKGDFGPNFPFNGKEIYGYDFTVMVNDFLNIVPEEKLVVVFGMFGYDWKVDENKKPLEQARAITLTVAKKQFIDQCVFVQCKIKRDEQSSEITVSYIDKEENKHVVWFEDEESVAKKREFLKEKGINSVGFWAYSYF